MIVWFYKICILNWCFLVVIYICCIDINVIIEFFWNDFSIFCYYGYIGFYSSLMYFMDNFFESCYWKVFFNNECSIDILRGCVNDS